MLRHSAASCFRSCRPSSEVRLGQPETDSLKITIEQFHIELLKEFR
jgi:hypothetical protein